MAVPKQFHNETMSEVDRSVPVSPGSATLEEVSNA